MKNYEIFEWLDVKNAVNRIYKKHLEINNQKISSKDYVKDICNNALPHAIIQTLAMECVLGEESHDLNIIKSAYKQLTDVGYIGTNN